MPSSQATVSATSRLPRVLSRILAVVGILMFIAGIAIYAGTSAALSAQHITVAAVTPEDPGPFAGQPAGDPITVLAQIQAIEHHVAAATGGKTFGEIKSVATSDGKTYSRDVAAEASTDGQAHKAGDPLSDADAKQYSGRITAQQGAWTQASLIVSEIAFGIGLLVTALGLIIFLLAVAQLAAIGALPGKKKAVAAEA